MKNIVKNSVKYNVLLTKSKGGYTATVPALSGCISQGRTVEEALENIKEAIELYLEVLSEDGDNLPLETNTISSFVDVFFPVNKVHA